MKHLKRSLGQFYTPSLGGDMDSEVTLSPRERQVAGLFAKELRPEEIAPRIGITVPAVKKVLWMIRKKLRLESNDELPGFIEENGLPKEKRRDFRQDVGTSDPYTRLAAAVLLSAAQDVGSQDPQVSREAVAFMADDGVELAEALGFDRARVQRWVEQLPIVGVDCCR